MKKHLLLGEADAFFMDYTVIAGNRLIPFALASFGRSPERIHLEKFFRASSKNPLMRVSKIDENAF